jgi:hypothetical protein
MKGRFMSKSNNDLIKEFFEAYQFENDRFTVNKVKSAAPKARKALQLLAKAIKDRRAEIMVEKKAMDEHKQK